MSFDSSIPSSSPRREIHNDQNSISFDKIFSAKSSLIITGVAFAAPALATFIIAVTTIRKTGQLINFSSKAVRVPYNRFVYPVRLKRSENELEKQLRKITSPKKHKKSLADQLQSNKVNMSDLGTVLSKSSDISTEFCQLKFKKWQVERQILQANHNINPENQDLLDNTCEVLLRKKESYEEKITDLRAQNKPIKEQANTLISELDQNPDVKSACTSFEEVANQIAGLMEKKVFPAQKTFSKRLSCYSRNTGIYEGNIEAKKNDLRHHTQSNMQLNKISESQKVMKHSSKKNDLEIFAKQGNMIIQEMTTIQDLKQEHISDPATGLISPLQFAITLMDLVNRYTSPEIKEALYKAAEEYIPTKSFSTNAELFEALKKDFDDAELSSISDASLTEIRTLTSQAKDTFENWMIPKKAQENSLYGFLQTTTTPEQAEKGISSPLKQKVSNALLEKAKKIKIPPFIDPVEKVEINKISPFLALDLSEMLFDFNVNIQPLNFGHLILYKKMRIHKLLSGLKGVLRAPITLINYIYSKANQKLRSAETRENIFKAKEWTNLTKELKSASKQEVKNTKKLLTKRQRKALGYKKLQLGINSEITELEKDSITLPIHIEEVRKEYNRPQEEQDEELHITIEHTHPVVKITEETGHCTIEDMPDDDDI